ncbi:MULTISPECIES: hypothetical protein [Methylosinus]|uniref:Uncharacterized protein n=1 Tax=Methylosinus trichosporium (strain ATCC 35070 / NCIMB 11131 / UNIQEM 75 / OB3b) TaxID=595536 RepID=A0A2D2CYF8_METT3|nr:MULTISPECIES: hypothetical protein [Methylosinus]ATQ67755.1 hypothetical protein CQW49_07505 [Methylosinus trichosporium OB3b]OBS51138.1 hypothetical protein A8B73_17600 [Methylosinus sp. 3S-1]
MRKFWLRAALAASHLRDCISAGAYAVCTFGVALANGCDGLVQRCERRARGELFAQNANKVGVSGLWGRSFTWPAPPEGWRVETGADCEFARRYLDRIRQREIERRIVSAVASGPVGPASYVVTDVNGQPLWPRS